MRFIFLIFICIIPVFDLLAQDKYYTKTGDIVFVSTTPVIVIAGQNKNVISFFNIKTGEMAFAVRMADFRFELPLAEEHFNENYAESEKFPTSKFIGKIKGYQPLNLDHDTTITVTVEGDLNIHGQTRTISETGILFIKDGIIKGQCLMKIKPEDYQIKIPDLVVDKIAKTVDVSVNVEYVLYTK